MVTTQPISLKVAPSAACMSVSATLTMLVSITSSKAPIDAATRIAHLPPALLLLLCGDEQRRPACLWPRCSLVFSNVSVCAR